MKFLEAVQYVGGGTLEEWRLGVDLQFNILQGIGLNTQSSVLEVGAGCLGLAHKLVEFLAPGNYTGIEPNVEVAQAGGGLNPGREPFLLHREDFDPAETSRTFDIAFAHSVLTHAAGWQLPLFLRNIRPHLRPGGLIVASLRWGEDTNATEWVYPKAVWFSPATIERVAAEEGFTVQARPEIRKWCEERLPRMFHDWAVFRPVGSPTP